VAAGRIRLPGPEDPIDVREWAARDQSYGPVENIADRLQEQYQALRGPDQIRMRLELEQGAIDIEEECGPRGPELGPHRGRRKGSHGF
jgi:hypothetical protein